VNTDIISDEAYSTNYVIFEKLIIEGNKHTERIDEFYTIK